MPKFPISYLIIASIVVGALAALVPTIAPSLLPRLQVPGFYSEIIEYPHSAFYRKTASFEMRATGESVDFDYVVACNTKIVRSRLTGTSDDGSFTPTHMLKVTADGSAVMLRTVDVCRLGTGSRGLEAWMPQGFAPFAIWFEKADDLTNGLGIVSVAGYDNPSGPLKLKAVSLQRATKTDWTNWRRAAERDYKPRENWPGPWGWDPRMPGLNDMPFKFFATTCALFRRMEMPPEAQQIARQHWPSDRPRFWGAVTPGAGHRDLLLELHDRISRVDVIPAVRPFPVRWETPYNFRYGCGAIPLRKAGWSGCENGNQAPNYGLTTPEIYPVFARWEPLASDTAPPLQRASIQFRDGAGNGLGGCQMPGGSLRSFSTFHPDRGPQRGLGGGTVEYDIDGVKFHSFPAGDFLSMTRFIENDRYIWRRETSAQ